MQRRQFPGTALTGTAPAAVVLPDAVLKSSRASLSLPVWRGAVPTTFLLDRQEGVRSGSGRVDGEAEETRQLPEALLAVSPATQ